ncbi:Trypsin-like peptidase domain-containing protein [Actinacidiphila alni]|uniref:Trypsin-like peptidase domain-containing protein n=1 Tax=Actinacidiphila alni TaxID=380248 RepID=A0A1I2I4E9_9ACTN|nr:trypsin-like peptidase domain-containing protein [Actinacidiphila alni]SFF36503.1 Trypsin-like peptidase domain-containing protein [Actinacidiphila alni]
MSDFGGPGEAADPAEILTPLVSAATVRVHGREPGYPLRGSGFFVAPNWVLTAAHVALAGQEPAPGGPGRKVSIGYGDRMLSGVVEWADPAGHAGGGRWPAPDLALIRLLDGVDHPCVWLTERTAKGYTTNRVAYFGHIPMDGEVVAYNGRCSISGQLGGGGLLKLGNEDEMPNGVSGGPVVDLVRGEVIGVLKARRTGQDGGLAIGIQELRRIPTSGHGTGGDDLYHRVMTAHDLHHADRYAFVGGQEPTWTDAHAEIGAAAGRALTPGQRTVLLGMLAQLPPPASTRSLQDIVGAVRGTPALGLPTAPRAWRDGLGLLYDLRRGTGELEAVLRYAVHAATADRTRPVDEAAERVLWHWAQDTAAGAFGLTRLFRNTLVTERKARLRARGNPLTGAAAAAHTGIGAGLRADPAIGLGTEFGAVLDPDPYVAATAGSADGGGSPGGAGEESPAGRIRPEALLELIPRGWEPGRLDWRVCVVPENGEVECVEEDFRGTPLDDLPARLRASLDEAFRRCDQPGYPAPLQLAVPGALVAFAADTWPLGPGGRALGSVRPVVIRRTDPPPDDDPARAEARQARWHTLHQQPPRTAVLDCDGGTPGQLPSDDELSARPRDTLPVLCRSAATAPEELHRLVGCGYPVAVWRREPVEPETACGDFHRGVIRTVHAARSAARLPRALAALRAAVAAGVPEAYWSRGVTLFYDDPTRRPLPGTDELLETP